MRCLNCYNPHISPEQKTCPKCGAFLPSLLQYTLPPGTQLRNGAYQIDYALDTGGFGTIYRAVHTSLDCLVAIKEFYPRTYGMRGKDGTVNVPSERKHTFDAERNQFLQEGRILADLNHRGVVNVLDLFEERNTAYLVMELLKGETLRRRLDQQPNGLNPDLVRKIVRQLVITLEMLQRRKPPIYHLDIKPENVFFTSSERAVLIDFGAARLGVDGYVVPQYDPLYAPPELLSDKRRGEVGRQTDLFELAMTAYELLTGQRPPSTQERVYSKNWNVADLQGDWLPVLEPALQLSKDKRPAGVLSWWVNTMGAGLPPFFKDKIDIFLDPEEAQVLLEKRLAERHIEYNELFLTNSRLRQENARLKKKIPGEVDTREKSEKDESVKLQEATEQKRKLEEKLQAKTNEANTLKSQQQKLENELQESNIQSQQLINEVTELRNKYEKSEQELKRLQRTMIGGKLSQGTSLSIYRQHASPVRLVAWSPDGLRIASAGSTIHIWDISSGASNAAHEVPDVYPFQFIQSLAWSPGNTEIALGGFGEVHILDVSKWIIRITYKDRFFDVKRAKNELNASEFGKLLQTSLHPLSWSPDGSCIASACNTSIIQFWNTATGMPFTPLDPHISTEWISALKWSPHGAYLASVVNGRYIMVWEVSILRRISIHTTMSSNFAWSPDSRYIASTHGNTVQIWAAHNATHIYTYRGHTDVVNTVAWSPDSTRIASASADGTVHIWQAA